MMLLYSIWEALSILSVILSSIIGICPKICYRISMRRMAGVDTEDGTATKLTHHGKPAAGFDDADRDYFVY